VNFTADAVLPPDELVEVAELVLVLPPPPPPQALTPIRSPIADADAAVHRCQLDTVSLPLKAHPR
jgi:hypothetical protein